MYFGSNYSKLLYFHFKDHLLIYHRQKKRKASCAAAARCVTVKPTGYGFDPHSRK